jgi:hypothetical protein
MRLGSVGYNTQDISGVYKMFETRVTRMFGRPGCNWEDSMKICVVDSRRRIGIRAASFEDVIEPLVSIQGGGT